MCRETQRVGGIVLCGGQSRRMQTPKHLLPFRGTTVLDHVVRTVRGVCGPVVVAARRGQEIPALPKNVQIVYDTVDGFGPLAGISAGFAALTGRSDAALVVACDYVNIKSEFLSRLAELAGGFRAAMPNHQGHSHPLLAYYSLSTFNLLQQQISGGERRVKKFAERCGCRVVDRSHFLLVDPDMESVMNVNNAGEFREATRKRSGDSN